MSHHTRSWMLLLCLPLLAATACGQSATCVVPGVAEACYCAASMPGARVCSEDKEWGNCDCSGNIALPNAVTPGQGGSGSGAGAAGSGSGSGASGSGAMRDSGMTSDDDGGVINDAGAAGSGAEDAAMPPPKVESYRACMSATDCDADAKCITTAGVPTSTVCAPACVNTVDCPVPEGTYEAKLACVTGYCQLDCTPVLFAPLLTCPMGMTCIAAALGNAFCHDDGMSAAAP